MRRWWVMLLAAFLVPIAAPRNVLPVPSVSFAAPTYIDLPQDPDRLLLADLNNDGRLDAVVSYGPTFFNSGGKSSVSVFLGRGDGTFGTRSDIPVYTAVPTDIATGDLNRDSNTDLVVAGGSRVSVLRGSGDGAFTAPSEYDVPVVSTRSIRLGDLNGDGNLDVIKATDTPDMVILPGIPGGAFGGEIIVPAPGLATLDVAIADLNGDGIPDLAVAGSNNVSALLGLGNFAYSTVRGIINFPSTGALKIEVADMNGDGKTDLVIAGSGAAVMLGLGNGDFGPLNSVTLSNEVRDLAVVDLNWDGAPDIVLAHMQFDCPECVVSIALGRGDGLFENATRLAVGVTASGLAVGDLNGDGNLDLAVATFSNSGQPRLAVLLSTLPPNQPPMVALTGPAAGAAFTAPAAVNLAAAASDPDGTVTRVEFFQGAVKLGEDATAADGFAFAWTGVPAGTYALTARATDNAGAVSTSAAVNVTVNAAVAGPPNLPPTVSLVSPADGSLFTPRADIAIEATASDGDGTVAKVEFFEGTTLLGEAAVAPYRFTWSGVPVGTYTLTARATDNAGAVTTSSPVRVTVGLPDAGGGGGACFSAARPPNRPGAGGPFLALGLLWGALSAIRASAAQRSAS